ncbi:BnaA06g03220D [Brassica napus]|uniref:BnaA06g03220D protein n=1 Tax=Brassica napus TaxID=3708 RepID=A0A078ID78_BRANA|nr:BnaA06g03220D [Brassica napus]
MYSSSSSSSFSAFTDLPSSIVGVTREEYYAFHKIDRTLFSRLVFDLNRDTNQTSQVIAFLFLLEQIEYARNLTPFLVELSDAFIDAVANEVDVCLSILHNLDYSTLFVANNDDGSVIPLLLRLTGGRLTLRYVHQHRETLLLGVIKNMNDICSRAFDDLCVKGEMYKEQLLAALEREKVIEEMSNIRLSVQQESPNRFNVPQGISTPLRVQQQTPIRLSVPQGIRNRQSTVAEEAESEEVVVLADDRTVFLTFSKGYPISESEVMVYFTRIFGEVIETILMQEVEENEQPLFARMVLKMECASKMDEIVGPGNKRKFTIDGKHVWARKYVRKNPSSTASPSSSHV